MPMGPVVGYGATLGVAVAGGVLTQAVGLAGGWLTGALAAVLMAGRFGAPMALPGWSRGLALAFSGLTAGAAVTPATLAGAGTFAVTLTALVGVVVGVTVASYWMHRAVWRASAPTALYASWPGNTLLAFVAAERSEADVSRVMLVQATRLLLLVAILPMAVGFVLAPPPPPPAGVTTLPDLVLALAATGAASLVGRQFDLPGSEMFLTAIVVGGLSGFGVISLTIPPPAISAFQVLVGAFIAVSLAGCATSQLRAAVLPALSGAIIGVGLSLGVAWPLALVLDLEPAALALAFAPGGAEPMILLAASFGVDPGFVGLHHTVRLIALTVVFPLILRLGARRAGR